MVIVLKPTAAFVEDMRVAVGVKLERAVNFLVIVLTGPMKLILMLVPLATAGNSNLMILSVQQEII